MHRHQELVMCLLPPTQESRPLLVPAVSLCREPDGTTPIDALLFLSTCLNDYSAASGGEPRCA